MTEKNKVSEVQINDLARPLVSIITKFYESKENEEAFEQWLQDRNITYIKSQVY